MDAVRRSPGPAAAQAYRLGLIASAVGGLAAIGLLYWVGNLSMLILGYVLVGLFPVYMVLASSLLSVWLGYSKDETALKPVYRSKNSE